VDKTELLTPDGRIARVALAPQPCPQCGAKPERRVLSGGFGAVHDVCGTCGYDFPERTL
jgi:hypothetical protein